MQKVHKPELTIRRWEAMKLACDGLSNRKVARAMGLREGTVKGYLADVMHEFRVRNRADLLRQALIRGYYQLPGYTLHPIPWQETIR